MSGPVRQPGPVWRLLCLEELQKNNVWRKLLHSHEDFGFLPNLSPTLHNYHMSENGPKDKAAMTTFWSTNGTRVNQN